MKLEDVKEFIKLAKEENVASLKYEKDDVKLSVTLPVAGATVVQTGVLERRQLVEAGKYQQGRCQPIRTAHNHWRQQREVLQSPLQDGCKRGKDGPDHDIRGSEIQ